MYQPAHFREDDLATQHALIRAHPLGLLISAGAAGLLANPVPFDLDAEASEKGVLRLHLARANPQWRAIAEGADTLAVFQGADAYITPSWYRTKQETGKVVPTWNYAIVQVRGTARVIEDAGWLMDQVSALTRRHEERRSAPWSLDDAPPDFLRAQLRGIVGIEIDIRRIDGKWKVSQNRPAADRNGVAEGLGDGQDDMAALVRAYGGREGRP
ncbi:FMN-binding negative transcriptional regulator [Ensifer soli]|uniref:FMN-binding negative transcriptional regulator n=1 Tax=Ciceribacter sp. sgz301302 TaxID=3342379 RepID=UPI0035BA7D6D